MKKISFVALGLMGLLQLLSLPNGYVGREHDDALYVLAADALRAGEYRHWFLPGRPPITTITPGLPALLLPPTLLFPGSLPALQVYMVLLLALCNAAVWLWLRRRHPPEIALALTGLFALNSLVLSRAGVVMPEAPFLLVALAVLLAWEKAPAWALGAGLLAAYLIRPAALPLLAAAALALAWRRDGRRLAGVLALPVLGVGAWALWARQGGGVQEAKELGAFYDGGALTSFFSIAGANLRGLAEAWGATLLPRGKGWQAAAPFAGLVLTGAAVTGLARKFRREDPADIFLGLSLAMHLVWPWWFDRYLLALLPFLLSKTVDALPAARSPRRLAGVLAGAAAVSFAVQGWLWLKPSSAVPPVQPAYDWIRRNSTERELFASELYGRDVLHAGRIFCPLPSAADAESFHDGLQRIGVHYVLWEDLEDLGFSLPENGALRELGRDKRWLEDPSCFRLVFSDERARIFQVSPGRKRTQNVLQTS